MPMDNQCKPQVDQVFPDTIDYIIQNSDTTKVVIGGDMNLDLSRHNVHDIIIISLFTHFKNT